MWCCEKQPGTYDNTIEVTMKERDDIKAVDEVEIKRWHLMLRENKACVEEENNKMLEKNIEKRQKNFTRMNMEKERQLEVRERNIDAEWERLEATRAELKLAKARDQMLVSEKVQPEKTEDKNASVIKIVIKMSKKEKKVLEMSDPIFAKEIELDKKEDALTNKEQAIEKKEYEMGEINDAFGISIQVKQFRKDHTFSEIKLNLT